MSETTLQVLLSTAAATGLLHTLIPDHWLPFVLIGRARGWSAGTTALVSGFSAAVHVGLSILLGLVSLVIGRFAAVGFGETLEAAGGPLLILFGLVYAVWSWRKGGHFHPGGALFHKHGGHGCKGEEGHSHPEHLHYHADDELIRESPGWSGWTLALVIGANPCVLMIPLILAAGGQGALRIGLVVAAYALPTVLLMTVLSTAGVVWSRRIRLPAGARYMEAVSGLLIALLGAAVWLLEG